MFKIFRQKIGIIGVGNMGLAIAERIKSRYRLFVFDKEQGKTDKLIDACVCRGIRDLVRETNVIILAVKPQDFGAVLSEIKDNAQAKLIISIAAGIETQYIEKMLGKVRVIRAMPNIAAKIGKAETVLCKGKNSKEKDLNFAIGLFNCIGETLVMNEDKLNAAAAISGSGPAYIYYDMQKNNIDPTNITEEKKQEYSKRLKKAAQRLGIDSSAAMLLAISTTNASIDLISAMGIPLEELRMQITSKGGITEAALQVLAKGDSWEEAALAAKKRAEELSKKE